MVQLYCWTRILPPLDVFSSGYSRKFCTSFIRPSTLLFKATKPYASSWVTIYISISESGLFTLWLWFATWCFLALSFLLNKKSSFRLILGSFLIGSKLLLHHSRWWDEVGWACGRDYKFREGNCSKISKTIPFDKSKEFQHVVLTHQRWLLLHGNLWWPIGLSYSCFEKLCWDVICI